MGIALRHDRRLMPQEPLHLIEVYPSLNHSRRKGMAKIMETKVVDLRALERNGQCSPDIAPIESSVRMTVEDEISRPRTRRVFIGQER